MPAFCAATIGTGASKALGREMGGSLASAQERPMDWGRYPRVDLHQTLQGLCEGRSHYRGVNRCWGHLSQIPRNNCRAV